MTQTRETKPGGTPENAVQEAVQQKTVQPHVRNYRAVLFQGSLIAALALFGVLAGLASTTAYFPIDLTITKLLQTLQVVWIEKLMVAVSWLGYNPQSGIIVVGFTALLVVFGFQWEAMMLFLATVAIQAVNLGAKYLVHRPRPPSSLVDVITIANGYSFPSGHVMFYVGTFGFLLFLAFALLKPSLIRTLLVAVFAALIVLVGVSRIYRGDHWASDVLGAYLLGDVCLALAVTAYRWGKPRFFVRQPVAPPSKTEVQAAAPATKAKESGSDQGHDTKGK